MIMNFRELFNGFEYELLEQAKNMERICDYQELDKPLAIILENSEKSEALEKKIEVDDIVSEKDDTGTIYKENGELLPNKKYEKNGITYETDSLGRIIKWEGEPEYEPENERDIDAQIEAGGSYRQEGDDGGHLVARVLGGSSGQENIVPMRDTINRGDYKKLENEIVEAKRQGKEVRDSGKIIYEENSERPSKIERTYIVEGRKNEAKLDNVEGSVDLLEDLQNIISKENLENLECEIKDMKEDGHQVSITSVLKKYDENGKLELVCVGIRDETSREKTYKTYSVESEAEF